MDDLNERVRNELERLTPSADGLERTLRRVSRRRSRRRLAAGFVGMALTVAVAAGLWTIAQDAGRSPVISPKPRPATIRSGLIVYGAETPKGSKQPPVSCLPYPGAVPGLTSCATYGSSLFTVGANSTSRLRPALPSGRVMAVSRDAKMVTFGRGISEGRGALFVMNLDTGKTTWIAGGPRDAFKPFDVYNYVALSPDSTRIAFSNGPESLDVINSDGTGRRRLFKKPGNCGVGSESWSPDGAALVYEYSCYAADGSSTDSIEIIKADGTGRKVILGPTKATDPSRPDDSTAVSYGVPSWSPDGNRIVFVEGRSAGWQICVMNSDGSNVVRFRDTSDFEAPIWSPDGTQIAFIGGPDKDRQIYAMNADGTGRFQVTNGIQGVFYLAWLPLAG